jgi:hypothetical protein
MAHMPSEEWAAMESLPEVEHLRGDVGSWDRLRQNAIGTAWARHASLTHLGGSVRDVAAFVADLTR